METVPFEFCERVSALWRCCEDSSDPDLCDCGSLPSFKAAKWSIAEKVYVTLYLETVDGKWMYGFTNPEYADNLELEPASKRAPEFFEGKSVILTARELTERRDFTHIQNCLKALKGELEQLLNFTAYLADEPVLLTQGLQHVESVPDGKMVIKWIEEGSFRNIVIGSFSALDQSLLEKRRKNGSPLKINVGNIEDDGGVLQDYLKSGKLRHLFAVNPIFPLDVMEAIIEIFRRNPDDYSGKYLKILAQFDETCLEKLEEMRENGLCRFERGKYYLFEAGEKHVSVDYETDGSYNITDDVWWL